ncbi:hypothetical protein D7252_06565 [Microbacterium sp. CGR2]|nr:hypothetical protein D7252_06565 [Microbacterium sp. CGR2]
MRLVLFLYSAPLGQVARPPIPITSTEGHVPASLPRRQLAIELASLPAIGWQEGRRVGVQ